MASANPSAYHVARGQLAVGGQVPRLAAVEATPSSEATGATAAALAALTSHRRSVDVERALVGAVAACKRKDTQRLSWQTKERLAGCATR